MYISAKNWVFSLVFLMPKIISTRCDKALKQPLVSISEQMNSLTDLIADIKEVSIFENISPDFRGSHCFRIL